MEYLQQYPSDSSDEDEDTGSFEESINVDSSQEPLEKNAVANPHKAVIPSTVESLKLFLQNYLFEQHQMRNVYLYMPWRPSGASASVVRSLSLQMEQHLKERFAPELKDYQFEKVATNALNVGYHISLTKNIPGNQETLHQFKKSIAKAFHTFEVDTDSVGPDLDALAVQKGITKLFGNNSPDLSQTQEISQCLQIRFQDTGILFASPDYASLFLGLPVRAEYVKMFQRMRSTIEDVMHTIDLPSQDGVYPDSFHLTIGICKNSISSSISSEVFAQMREHMTTVQLDTSDLCFNTNSVMVRTIPSSEPDMRLPLQI